VVAALAALSTVTNHGSYLAVTFYGVWICAPDGSGPAKFLDLEGLSWRSLPAEEGPDRQPWYPFEFVSTSQGELAPPPTVLRFYAPSDGERALWTAAVEAAILLWASHASPAAADGRLLLRSSVFDQFGLLRKASGYLLTSAQWRSFVLEFNRLHYSRSLSLYEFDRYGLSPRFQARHALKGTH